MRTLPFAPLLLALSLLGLPSVALADPSAESSEQANALFKKGKEAYNDGRTEDALRLYTQAWDLKQSPDIAANLAQTEADLHMPRAAADHFAYALDHLLPSSTEEQKKALNDGLELEKKEIGTLHITLEPADAHVAIDGVAVTLRTTGDVYVEPGEHKCVVTREGYATSEQTVQISKGRAQVLWIRLKGGEGGAAAAPAAGGGVGADSGAGPDADGGAAHDGGGHGRSLVPAIVGGGIAVVGIAAGVAFMISGNSHADKSKTLSAEIPGDNGCGAGSPYGSQCGDLQSENKSVRSARVFEVVSFGVAGAAALGSIVYLLWPAKGTGAVAAPSVALRAGIGTLTLVGQF